MSQSFGYKDLEVWQDSMRLVPLIYKLTDFLPETEKYNLVIQMRRCAVSIPSNLAEGRSRATTKEYFRFTNIAFASAAELETQMNILKNINLYQFPFYEETYSLLQQILRQLNSLLASLEVKIKNN
jgi:four helix bundle protein